MIRQGIAEGTIRDCDPRLMASAIFGALNWVPHWNRSDSPMPSKQIAEAYLELIISGLAPGGTRAQTDAPPV